MLADWQKPVDLQRPMLDVGGLIGNNGALGYAKLGYEYLDGEMVSLCELVGDRLASPVHPHNFGLIHGDLHLNNVISHQGILSME